MSMKPKYILMAIVAWLIAAVSFIIPRLISIQPITTNATNATNTDIVNAIYSLKDTIYAANYSAMGLEIGFLVTAMILLSKR
ncbi:hypothetical protein ES708_34569 [subsurface metagenome]